jgi:hypothetical protein
MSGGCHLIRCPYCGYETVPEPAWIGGIRKMFRKTWWRTMSGLKLRNENTAEGRGTAARGSDQRERQR